MRRRGFTFIEMVLVIGMIAVLAAILFPVFARARENARSHSCRANLLNIGLALRTYAHEHDALYPPHDYDMSPLHPKYLPTDIVFTCPSGSYDGEDSIRMVPPDWEPPEPEESEEPPAEPSPPEGEPGMGGPPGMEPGMEPGMGAPAWHEDLLKTSYLYHGGAREHNEMPLAGLVADSDTRHNDRANVLMSDGAIKTASRTLWLELGFGEELPDYLPQQHDPYGPPPMMEPGMSEPPPPPSEEPPPPPGSEPPPGMEPGMEPPPAPESEAPMSPEEAPPGPPAELPPPDWGWEEPPS